MENNIDSKINGTRDGVTQIGKDLRADAHAAIDRVADKVPPAADRVATSAHNGVDKVANGAEKLSGSLEHVSERVALRSKQIGEGYKALAESGRSHVRSSPAISVLLAAAAGYGLSKLLTSRK